MDNPQFLALIQHLGDDVGYMSRKMEQDVTKCVVNFQMAGDAKKFCRKLAGVLLNFSMYGAMYAHTLKERIVTYQLEGELSDVLANLNEITMKEGWKQCEHKAEIPSKIDVTTQTEQGETTLSDNIGHSGSDSSQNTVLYNDSLKLLTSQENATRRSSTESLHSILSRETTVNQYNVSDGTTDTDCANCAGETKNSIEHSQIFTANHSVDLEVKDTLDHLLEVVSAAISKSSQEVDHLMEELSNAISGTSQTGKVMDMACNSQETVKKKLREEDRLALLKVIKQFCVRKIRGRRTKKILGEQCQSSSDEMPPQKPRRKKKKPVTEKESDGNVPKPEDLSSSEGRNNIPDKSCESEDALLLSSLSAGVPARRKSVPLPETPSDDTESQLVVPFKRKIVQPLLSSHSEFEDEGVQKNGSKRVRPSSESDLDSLKGSQTKRPRLFSESGCSPFKLDAKGRNELLSLLEKPTVSKETPADVSDSDVEFVSVGPITSQFNLNSSDRDDFLNLLSNKEDDTKEEDSESLTPFQLNDKERDELLELLVQSSLDHENDRDTLIELIKEFEGSMINELLPGNKECDVVTTGSFAGSLDGGSPLLDILREETVDEQSLAKRGRGRPKVPNKETWEAFESLLESDDDLLSSSSSSDLSDTEVTLSLRGLDRKTRPVISEQAYTKFGLDKELFVDVEQADFSHFDLSEFMVEAKKRKPRLSSSSSSLLSDVTDFDSLGFEGVVTPPALSADEEPFRLAASLLDSIRNSSDEDDSSENESSSSTDESNKSSRKQKKTVELDSSDEEDFVGVRKPVPAWKRNPLLNMDISDSDSDSDEPKKRVRKPKPINLDAESDDSDVQVVTKKSSPLKTFQVDDDSDDSDFEIVSVMPEEKTSQKVITLSDEEVGKSSKGRRNIRALMQEEDLAEATQTAHNEERERIKRLVEKDKAMEVFSQSLSFASQFSEDDCNPLILDVQETTQIKVHPKITIKLKPHQREGIRFMWDSCYESVVQLQAGYKGSGCILAHCMGLGKTLQALALIQTLFANPVTKTKHVLVVCPLSTVSNWKNEYKLAYKGITEPGVKFYSIEDKKAAKMRFSIVKKWRRTGGMLVMGYECFGLMVNEEKLQKWENEGVFDKASILQALVDPGPNLVICDEGHLLRNKQSQRTLALNKVSTRRRIVLTGTPLQNNLLEYYYMVNFVKPNLLGTEKEYKINFVNPIINGQFEDSTAEDIMFMKKRTHVLHKILNRTVQRVEDTELKQYLPKLIDQAVFIKLSDLQVELYNTYLDSTNSRPVIYTKSGTINRKNFLADVQILRYICVHPNVLTTAEQNGRSRFKEQDVIGDVEDELDGKVITKGDWYKNLLKGKSAQHLSAGSKLLLALGIVEEAAENGDKTLIFSQSLAEMDNLEKFLVEALKYKNKRDYYRMDGTVSPEVRTHMCDRFNSPDNRQMKVFIMSTKVGGLGLNLTAANRVIIMSVSWNPSYDTQSVFRAFRFGQNKSVYVYRLIAMDTMEEKMYQRSVTKLAIAHRVVDKHQITRHYNSADIQEYYSVRPTKDKTRPVPNLPEDRVLAKLIQKHQVLFKWHEHQALLTNRPEEDLDEQQKNAAWEEFNKRTDPALTNPGNSNVNSQNVSQRVFNPAAVLVNAQMNLRARAQRLGLNQLYESAAKRNERGFPGPSKVHSAQTHHRRKIVQQSGKVRNVAVNDINDLVHSSLSTPVTRSGSGVSSATPNTNLEEVNTILAESLSQSDEVALTTLVIHDSSDEEVAAHPDHNYSLPKSDANFDHRTTSAEDFKPVPTLKRPVLPTLNRPRPLTNKIAGPSSTVIRPDDKRKIVQAILNEQIAKTQKAVREEQNRQAAPNLTTNKLVLQRVTPILRPTYPGLKVKDTPPLEPTALVAKAKATPIKGKDAPPMQSPLQQQMRSSMEQLHKLQQQSYLTANSVTLKAAANLTSFNNHVAGSEQIAANQITGYAYLKQPNKTYERGQNKGVKTPSHALKKQSILNHQDHTLSKPSNHGHTKIDTTGHAYRNVKIVPGRSYIKAFSNGVVQKHPQVNKTRAQNGAGVKVVPNLGHAPINPQNHAQFRNVALGPAHFKAVNTSGQGDNVSLNSGGSHLRTVGLPKTNKHFKAPNTSSHDIFLQNSGSDHTHLKTPNQSQSGKHRRQPSGSSRPTNRKAPKPNHAPKNTPQVKQDVTDWIAQTLKFIDCNYNASGKGRAQSSPARPTNRGAGASPTLRQPTNRSGTFVKRLVNAPSSVKPSGLVKPQWRRKCPASPEKINVKKKGQPGTDKENHNFQVSDVVQSLEKQGVSVNLVNTSTGLV